MDLKPTTNYPEVYDSKVLNSTLHTGTGGETHLFESKQGGYKKSRRRKSKRKQSRHRRRYKKSLRK